MTPAPEQEPQTCSPPERKVRTLMEILDEAVATAKAERIEQRRNTQKATHDRGARRRG